MRWPCFVLAIAWSGVPCFAPSPALASEDPTILYPSTYFPDSPSPEGATPVSLGPGDASAPLALQLISSGGILLIRILSSEGRDPVVGILVEARIGRFTAVGRTGADGRALITGIPAGPATIRTRPDDPRSETGAFAIRYAPGVREETEAARFMVMDGATMDAGELIIPPAARIKAVVLRPGGARWAGIPAVVRSIDGSFRREALTNASGQVSFGGLESGWYRLWADARGTYAITEAWDGSRDTLSSTPIDLTADALVKNIVLTPDRGAEIRGSVRDRETNRGLPGIEVRILPVPDPASYYTFRTDDFGVYAAPGLVPGAYKIYAPTIRRYYIDAETEAEARTVVVEEGGSTDGIDLRGKLESACLIPPGSAGVIEGTLRADFERLPTAKIRVWGERDTIEQVITVDGVYRIGCIPAGNYCVGFFPDGVYRTQYHPKVNDIDSAAVIFIVAADTTRRIDFEPQLGVTVQGTAIAAAEQAPLPGIPVVAMRLGGPEYLRTVTSEEGTFLLNRLPDGSGMPAGAWIVGTDSITVAQVALTPALSLGLDALRAGRQVLLAFTFPEGMSVSDWSLERRSMEGPSIVIARAEDHPEGLFARGYADHPGPGMHAYRLEVEVPMGGRAITIRSDWTGVEIPMEGMRAAAPQPWDGGGDLMLPIPAQTGGFCDVVAPGGERLYRIQLRGDRFAFPAGTTPPAGIYFLRWRDTAGGIRTARMVLVR